MHKFPKQISRKPTVLQVLPSLINGGVERGTIEMARAIAQAGWTSLVASSGGPLLPSVSYAGATHITLPLESKNPLRMWMNARALEKVIRKHKIDIVHARSRAPAWSAYLAAKHTGANFITTFHGMYGLENDWKRRYNTVMTRGERVIAISHFVAEHLRSEYRVPEGKLRVIHRGVDLKIFHPARVHAERMIALAREWRLPEDLPVILFPGRITRWKGQDVFIRALAKLKEKKFLALLVGDDTNHTDYRAELEKLIVAEKLEGHVRMVGQTVNMAEAYTLSKLVVSTSVEPEAFGRVALEAQALGRPIIASDHGGARETVIPGQTGWLVKPGDADALAACIAEALTLSDEDLTTIGLNGMENAQQFTAQAMCDRTLDVYRELLLD